MRAISEDAQAMDMCEVFPTHLLPCFPYERMNRMQQEVLPVAFTSREHLVVSAPAGTTSMQLVWLQWSVRVY